MKHESKPSPDALRSEPLRHEPEKAHHSAPTRTSAERDDISLRDYSFSNAMDNRQPAPWIERHITRHVGHGTEHASQLQQQIQEALAHRGPKAISSKSNEGAVEMTVENRAGKATINIGHILNRDEKTSKGIQTYTQSVLEDLSKALRAHADATAQPLRVELTAQQVINQRLQQLLERAGFKANENAPQTVGRSVLEGVGVLIAGYAVYAASLDWYLIAGATFLILSSMKGKSYTANFEISPEKAKPAQ